jgi:hypothetical protein
MTGLTSEKDAYLYLLQPYRVRRQTTELFPVSSFNLSTTPSRTPIAFEMASSTNDLGNDDLRQGMTGSCLCGSVKVILRQDVFSKPNGHICYCESCRKSTGTTGFNGLSTTKDKVEIQDPKQMIKTYIDSATDSGRTIERNFCSNCGR